MKRKMSKEALDRLKAELFELETRVRSENIRRIKEAREHGDLSENAEYHAAREEQARIEAKIRELAERIKNTEVGVVVDDGIVSHGKIVTFRQIATGEMRTYLYAEREEARDGLEALSPHSPLGRAIAGAKPGDRVTYEAPAGRFEIEVIEVRAS